MNKNIYKFAFDLETKKWDYSKCPSYDAYEAEVNNPLFDPGDETVKFIDLFTDEDAARIVNRWNQDLVSGYRVLYKCKDCGRIFFIDAKEKDWYINKNYQLPKRCKPCRAEKKKKAEANNEQQ